MTEELQTLIDRIQKDGVEKAEERAGTIVAKAEKRARELVEQAKAEAETLQKTAERDAEAFQQRAETALQQAARDVVLGIGRTLENYFQSVMREDVSTALDSDAFRDAIIAIAKQYAEQDGSAVKIVSDETQAKALSDRLVKQGVEKAGGGVSVVPVGTGIRGFRIAVDAKHVEHDFTAEAVTEALSQVLRPRLAAILKSAMEQSD